MIVREYLSIKKKGRNKLKDLLNIEMCSDTSKKCLCLEDLPLAYSYVPYQYMKKTYDAQKALMRGTAFPELDKPFGVYGNEFKTKEGVRLI